MEGFVLPPFESTEILKDKELICVKKKGGPTTDAVDPGNLLEDAEANVLEPENNHQLLLANDKFDDENEEHQSESEEDDEEQLQDEEELPEEQVTKKRKAPMKLQNSKNKRQCLGVLNDAEKQETDNVKNVDQVNPPGAKKMPSRTARRKKAKRKWMQELKKISKKKPQEYSKPEVTKTVNKEADGGPKGLLHWKQATSKKPVHKNHKNTVEQEKNGDVGVVNRPGHIRFENLDEDQPAKQTAVSNETFRWNGSNGKKKGQRWGTGKFSNYQRNDSKVIDKKSFRIPITDMKVPVIDPNDFNKLPPCCSPKEGDVIAYRLLELSSTWIPEFSSFRVGRISYYDARDIVLIPVPEYPIATDKTDENRPNDSLYGEDGSLEINYSALLDVCYVKQYEPEANKTVSNGVVEQAPVIADKDTTTNVSKDFITGNGEANAWDQFSKVNSNTEMTLPDVNHSGGDPGPSEVPDTGKPESSENKDKEKGIMGNPWVNNANKGEESQENQTSLTGWTGVNKVVGSSSENDCGEGSSWGRPWSSFVASKGSSVNVQQNEWGRASSRGNDRSWSRGGPRGRGRGGRGRGRGRNS